MKNKEPADLSRLASFPEHNPNPVIELSLEGKVIYLNPAARACFPGILESSMDHPLFSALKEKLADVSPETLNGSIYQAHFQGRTYEQKMFFFSDGNVIRIYSSDITEHLLNEKKLANLALFPEHNPNPVIEADYSRNLITYRNTAAQKKFSNLEELGLDHPLFDNIRKRIHLGREFRTEVTMDDSIFEQKIFFIQDTTLIRVYSHDITDQKKIEKSLSRLASFPEQNPSPIIELDLNGNITYFNPACLLNFPEFYSLKLEHPILKPLTERYNQFKTFEIDHYSVEIQIENKFFTQRGRYLPENGVIRIFNLDITQQKENEAIIREKNKDITDSINYARKIQQSILPSEELLRSACPDSFVLYQPKDIISGDFYWYLPVGSYLLFACADCTGHGVPGALMSMIGSNMLSLIVNEKEIITPDQVLMELDTRVRKALKQDEEDSKDGMDLSFCALQLEKKVLHYSGANRPMALIRDGVLTEYQADKFPIGGRFNPDKKFRDNVIQLMEGDRLYFFTDGITDQFGGPKGKKLMKRRFYEILVSIHHLSMREQQSLLQKEFSDWKGELEQVDDVLVMGIRI